jgi:L-cysteine desulfidase
VEKIYRFVVSEEVSKFEFMEECIRMNRTAAEEGLKGDYGLNVGKSLFESIKGRPLKENVPVYAAAMAAAAARMSGSTLPVMTVCGSGNQGLTATLPVIAAAEAMELDKEKLLRALALSCLTTIHVNVSSVRLWYGLFHRGLLRPCLYAGGRNGRD